VQITGEADLNGRDRDRKSKRLRDRAGTGAELPSTTLPTLISLMRMTYEEWDEWTRGSAMRRSGYAGFRRNVAVALGNWGSPDAVPVLIQALSDPDPLVRQHVAWALGQVRSVASVQALSAASEREDVPAVREEFDSALDRLRAAQPDPAATV
jgi:HEAT repeat protein